MLVFEERENPRTRIKTARSRGEPTNSTHIWCQVWDSNPGLIGWRQVLSPPCQLCTHKKHCTDAQSAAFRMRSTDSPPAAAADVEAPWVEWPEYPNSIPAIHKGLINHRETDWLEMALWGEIKHTSSWKDLRKSLVLSTYVTLFGKSRLNENRVEAFFRCDASSRHQCVEDHFHCVLKCWQCFSTEPKCVANPFQNQFKTLSMRCQTLTTRLMKPPRAVWNHS